MFPFTFSYCCSTGFINRISQSISHIYVFFNTISSYIDWNTIKNIFLPILNFVFSIFDHLVTISIKFTNDSNQFVFRPISFNLLFTTFYIIFDSITISIHFFIKSTTIYHHIIILFIAFTFTPNCHNQSSSAIFDHSSISIISKN